MFAFIVNNAETTWIHNDMNMFKALSEVVGNSVKLKQQFLKSSILM